MGELTIDLFQYVKHPYYVKITFSWKAFFEVFMIDFIIITIIWFIDLTFLSDRELLENKLFINFKNQFLPFFVLGTTIVPLYEEFLHRIYLTTTKQYISNSSNGHICNLLYICRFNGKP